MRNLRALIFSVLFIQLSCNQHESREYIQKLDNPELFTEWNQSYQNKFNNYGSVSFLNKGNYKPLRSAT